jgi:hypothetical protein
MKILDLIYKHRIILIILTLGFLFNFLVKWQNIDSIPPGATYDEIIYIAESQNILKYGTDLSGEWRPWHFEPSDGMYTELTSTVLIPGFIIFPNNPILASKLMPVLLGSLIPLFIALIVYYFYRKPIFLITTIVVTTLNPWMFQFSRTGFDSLFSIFFYLLGILMLLYLRNWLKLWSTIPFLLGFFQYQGHKPLLIPLITIVSLILLIQMYNFSKKRFIFSKNVVPIIIVFIFSLILSGVYMLRLNALSSSVRSDEIRIMDSSVVTRMVDEKRRLSLDNYFSRIFNNKPIVYSSIITHRFLNSFDLEKLFFRGDASIDTFTVTDHGFFHWIDIVGIFLFFAFMIKGSKNFRLGAIFIVGIAIVGTVPNLIRDGQNWITFRGAFSFIALMMMISVGLGIAVDYFNNKVKNSGLLMIILYVLFTTSFFYIYFNRYPITQTLHNGFYERLLANYVLREPKKSFVLITDRSDATFDYILTYNQIIKTEPQKNLQNASRTKQRYLENNRIFILENCPTDWSLVNEDTIIAIDLVNEPCSPPDHQNPIEIKSIVDSGTRFKIYGDTLCSGFSLGEYSHLKQNKLSVEKLTDEDFCTTYFSK